MYDVCVLIVGEPRDTRHSVQIPESVLGKKISMTLTDLDDKSKVKNSTGLKDLGKR